MPYTTSDWIFGLKQNGLEELAAAFHSDKKVDYNRVLNSGLPHLELLQLPYEEFSLDNDMVKSFFEKYHDMIPRAVPNTPDLARKYAMGLKDFDSVKQFLDKEISKENSSKYTVLITEKVPEKYGGIIISRRDDLIIELTDKGLANLSHGENPAITGIYANHNSHSKTMRYSNDNPVMRKLAWDSVQYLRKQNLQEQAIPEMEFMKGYFEFVISDAMKTYFVDYKINPAYLK